MYTDWNIALLSKPIDFSKKFRFGFKIINCVEKDGHICIGFMSKNNAIKNKFFRQPGNSKDSGEFFVYDNTNKDDQILFSHIKGSYNIEFGYFDKGDIIWVTTYKNKAVFYH